MFLLRARYVNQFYAILPTMFTQTSGHRGKAKVITETKMRILRHGVKYNANKIMIAVNPFVIFVDNHIIAIL